MITRVSPDRRASEQSAARLAASCHAQRVRVREGLEPSRLWPADLHAAL